MSNLSISNIRGGPENYEVNLSSGQKSVKLKLSDLDTATKERVQTILERVSIETLSNIDENLIITPTKVQLLKENRDYVPNKPLIDSQTQTMLTQLLENSSTAKATLANTFKKLLNPTKLMNRIENHLFLSRSNQTIKMFKPAVQASKQHSFHKMKEKMKGLFEPKFQKATEEDLKRYELINPGYKSEPTLEKLQEMSESKDWKHKSTSSEEIKQYRTVLNNLYSQGASAEKINEVKERATQRLASVKKDDEKLAVKELLASFDSASNLIEMKKELAVAVRNNDLDKIAELREKVFEEHGGTNDPYLGQEYVDFSQYLDFLHNNR